MDIRIRRIHQNAILPKKATECAAGYDLYACLDNDVHIPPGTQRVIPCGINVRLPVGWEAQIRPRSGLSAKYGISITNSPGTLDADFDGDGPDFEVKVILRNHGFDTFKVAHGDRIAQMVFQQIPYVSVVEDFNLNETRNNAERTGGFGSTGT